MSGMALARAVSQRGGWHNTRAAEAAETNPETEMKNLIQRLQAHGRADELNALVEDTKRLRHSERQAVEAAQTALMDAAKAVEAQAAEITRLRDALAGLVACKTMKDDLDLRMQKDTMSAADQSVWFALAAEYASRKASAWDAAHAALLQDSKRT